MIIRLTRYGLALLLLLVAVRYPLGIWAIHDAMSSLLGRKMGIIILLSDLERGVWMFFMASAIGVIGALGLFLRKTWGRVCSMIAFGLFAVLELSIAAVSSQQAQDWFSFSESRWQAGTEAVIFSAGLAWLLSPLAKREVQFAQTVG